ncbi:MAG TPA: carbohydrate-binding family 9-like protein [Terriglobales bacterium]|nr:carbohydrate-binding family 9-like protein [Terriglobales bacterium]
MSQTIACSSSPTTISALHLAHEITLDALRPAGEWAKATPVAFCADWQGKNADAGRQTEVRAMWTPHTLYVRFTCRYRDIIVFEDSDPSGRRDHLWDRDVAEAFLQPDTSQKHHYKEFEVSPNGQWIDLDIGPSNITREEPPRDLKSGLMRSVYLDKEKGIWEAELAIPMRALTSSFDPKTVWRANFFRVEGKQEPRFYSAWQATKTPEPNFHVPEAFGFLKFEK